MFHLILPYVLIHFYRGQWQLKSNMWIVSGLLSQEVTCPTWHVIFHVEDLVSCWELTAMERSWRPILMIRLLITPGRVTDEIFLKHLERDSMIIYIIAYLLDAAWALGEEFMLRDNMANPMISKCFETRTTIVVRNARSRYTLNFF